MLGKRNPRKSPLKPLPYRPAMSHLPATFTIVKASSPLSRTFAKGNTSDKTITAMTVQA